MKHTHGAFTHHASSTPGHAGHARHPLAAALLGISLALHGALLSPLLDDRSMVQAAEQRYDIPAGPLGATLSRFAGQAGVVLSFDAQLTAGKQSPGLQGSYSVAQGFARLLGNSGLQAVEESDGDYSLRAAAENGALALPDVAITGRADQESAWGPVDGYVATRSASATKTDTPLIETPSSISVVTRQQIEAQQAKTVTQALRYTPGVTAEISGPQFATDSLIIRGFQQGTGRMLRDGMRTFLSDYLGWDAPEPYGIERIEVLRGASSVLYGAADPGGQINLVSKRPPQTPLHAIQLQGGSFDYKHAAFDFGGPLDDQGEFSYRLTGLVRDSNAQTEHVENERTYIAPAFTWRPSDATELTLLGEYQLQKGNFTNGVPAQGTVLSNPNGDIDRDFYIGEPDYDRATNEKTAAGYAFEHRFDDVWSVRQNLRFSHYRHDSKEIAFNGWTDASLRNADRYAELRQGSGDLFTVDNQVQARFASGPVTHTVLAGLDYSHGDYEQEQAYALATSLDVFNPSYGNGNPITLELPASGYEQTIKQTGLYLQDQLKFDEHWVLLLGGRYDWVKNENTAAWASEPVQRDEKFSGRAGLVYLFDNGLAPYLSYSQSFLPAVGRTAGDQVFEPEEGVQYEVGLKYEPAGGGSLYTIAAFELTKENVSTPDPENPGSSIQEGEIRSRGIELEAKTRIAEGLDLLAGYTWNDVEVSESNEPAIKGNRPFRVPEHIASLWLDYQVQGGPLAGLGVGGGVRYVGSTYGDRGNSFEVPSYTVFDALLRYDLRYLDSNLDGLKLSLNASNLFDKEYIAACFSLDGCQFGQARTLYATVDYAW